MNDGGYLIRRLCCRLSGMCDCACGKTDHVLLDQNVLRVVYITKFAHLSVVRRHCNWSFSISAESKYCRSLVNNLEAKLGSSNQWMCEELASPNDPIGTVS